jgi:hydroxyacylglutathione hydrolase
MLLAPLCGVPVLVNGLLLLLHAQVVGPKADAARIPGIDVQLAEGDTWSFGELSAELAGQCCTCSPTRVSCPVTTMLLTSLSGDLEVHVFDTPGHTRGHITFWLPHARALFVGGWVRAS